MYNEQQATAARKLIDNEGDCTRGGSKSDTYVSCNDCPLVGRFCGNNETDVANAHKWLAQHNASPAAVPL